MRLRTSLAIVATFANLSGCALAPPALGVEVPAQAEYLGVDRFVLLGIADCELHVYVEADAGRNVRRLYWIQREGYLPSRPELHHAYDSPRHATLGGLDFYVDTWVSPEKPQAFEPDSDVTHMRELVRARGYALPPRMRSVRFVHLLDAAKRNELMIIYAEALPAEEAGIVERAAQRVKIGAPQILRPAPSQ
jgi:hypothetical protein